MKPATADFESRFARSKSAFAYFCFFFPECSVHVKYIYFTRARVFVCFVRMHVHRAKRKRQTLFDFLKTLPSVELVFFAGGLVFFPRARANARFLSGTP